MAKPRPVVVAGVNSDLRLRVRTTIVIASVLLAVGSTPLAALRPHHDDVAALDSTRASVITSPLAFVPPSADGSWLHKPNLAVPSWERDALLDLWRATGGADGRWLRDDCYEGQDAGAPKPCGWGNATDPCASAHPNQQFAARAWFGVWSCATDAGGRLRVTGLSMPSNGLSGTLPESIGRLSEVTVINLHGNQLTGTLPRALSNMSGLTSLDLGANTLSGSLPVDVLTHVSLSSLDTVDLSANAFAGTLPRSVGDLRALKFLDLNGNRLSGTLPDVLGMQDLRSLSLQHNLLTGTLPDSLARATMLEEMYLYDNQLTGEVLPGSLHTMPSLRTLDVHNNDLTGAVPSLYTNVKGGVPPRLDTLIAHGNRLSTWNTTVDAAHGNISASLTRLDVADNEIVAELDAEFSGNVLLGSAMSHVSLAGNPGLTGDVEVIVYFGLRYTAAVDLSGTGVSGLLYSDDASGDDGAVGLLTDLGSASPLTLLWLRGCGNITGNLPSDLPSLLHLVSLDIMGTGMHSASLPPYLVPPSVATVVSGGTALCRRPVAAPGVALSIDVGDGYDGYVRCGCAAGHAGKFNGLDTDCRPCAPGSWSDGSAQLGGESHCTPCKAGTAQNASASAERTGAFTCVPCADGTASAGGATLPCFRCPGGLQCTGGQVSVQPNHWWSGGLSLSSSTALYECLAPGSCNVAAANSNITGGVKVECREGSGGVLCAVCDRGFTRTAPGHCLRCPHLAVVVAVSVFAVLVLLGFLAFKVRQRRTRFAPSSLQAARGAMHQADAGDADTRSALRILVSFLQLTAATSEFRARGSALVSTVLSHAGSAGGDSIAAVVAAPFHCAVELSFVDVLWLAAGLPVACVALVAANAARARTCCAGSTKKTTARAMTLREEVVMGVAVVVYLVYSRVTKVALAAFKAHVPAINGRTYLEVDFRVTTDGNGLGEYHRIVPVAIAILAVYTVAMPLAAAVAVWRWRQAQAAKNRAPFGSDALLAFDSLNTGDAAMGTTPHPSLSLLTRGYRREIWWWEGAVVARKVAFAMLVVFVTDAAMQSVASILVLLVALCAQMALLPYIARRLNAAEALSLFALIVTQAGQLMYALPSATAVLQSTITIALLVLNGGVVVWLLRLWLGESPWYPAVKWCRRRCGSGELVAGDSDDSDGGEYAYGSSHGGPLLHQGDRQGSEVAFVAR